MSVSIKLYRIKTSENIDEITDLAYELNTAKNTVVDLYKMTEDIGIVLMNKVDPFDDDNEIGYKIMYGNYIDFTVEDRQCEGYLPTSAISSINKWIKEIGIDTFDGFSKLYNNLSLEVQEQLADIGSPEKEELYDGYVKNLVELYQLAEQEKNSIIICGE